MERVAEPLHANLRGAAMFAALALGEVDPDEINGLVAVDARFEPDAARGATYDRLYHEFPKLYRSQKPMFARLNRHRNQSEGSGPY
jgi:xylulokinase